jgi:hypothetical protein
VLYEAVTLVALVVGQPPGTPGLLIETFQDRTTCLEYKERAGWEMLRSAIGYGSPNTHLPVPGWKLECLTEV